MPSRESNPQPFTDILPSNPDEKQAGVMKTEVELGATYSSDVHSLQNLSDLSITQRLTLLAIFCLALFTDAYMTSAMLICLNGISTSFREATNLVTWIMTAYSLTFGSFLLLAGRVSDIYHPKPVFIGGFLLLGILGLGAGFVNDLIPLIVFRALQGVGAAMTIPSATAMLTSAYTTPLSRGLALTAFAGAGTLGLCAGFIIGGIMVQFASWRWVLWIVPTITVPLSVMSAFLIPGSLIQVNRDKKKMDVVGIATMTGSIILFIFSLSQAPNVGWGTKKVLLPLVISIIGFSFFFFWQTRLEETAALIPPKVWFIRNFLALVFISLCTQIYLTGPVLIFSVYWPIAYGWSPLTIGLHSLPMGVTAVIVCVILPAAILKIPPKTALIVGTLVSSLCSIFLVFAHSKDRYWSFIFPSMVLITLGSTTAYIVSNIGIVTSVPQSSVGVASAIFSAAQQIGGAINVAVITTIFVQVRDEHPLPSYTSAASAFWFLVALGLGETVMVIFFFKHHDHVDARSY